MRSIYQQDKRGISNMIAYVILISITLSLSVLVYNWLRFQFGEEVPDTCSERVNLVLSSYDCPSGSSWLKVDIKNKGLFDVDGYILRVHNRPGADFGLYTVDPAGFEIEAGESFEYQYNFTQENYPHNPEILELGDITFLEIQPFVLEGSKKINCPSISTQDIQCS